MFGDSWIDYNIFVVKILSCISIHCTLFRYFVTKSSDIFIINLVCLFPESSMVLFEVKGIYVIGYFLSLTFANYINYG